MCIRDRVCFAVRIRRIGLDVEHADQLLVKLQAIADQMALIIHAARKYRALAGQHNALLDGLSARQRESDTLRRLTSIVSSTVDLDEMLTHALREAALLLDCEGAQVLLPDLATYQLVAHEPSQIGLVRAWGRALWALAPRLSLIHISEPTRPY